MNKMIKDVVAASLLPRVGLIMMLVVVLGRMMPHAPSESSRTSSIRIDVDVEDPTVRIHNVGHVNGVLFELALHHGVHVLPDSWAVAPEKWIHGTGVQGLVSCAISNRGRRIGLCDLINRSVALKELSTELMSSMIVLRRTA